MQQFVSRNSQTTPTKTREGSCKWRIFCQCKCGNVGSALQLESKQRLNNLFKDLERHQNGHSSQYLRSCPCPQRTMAECGPRVRKYRRFQVGAFMAVHKQKREEAVRQSEKTIAENLKNCRKGERAESQEAKVGTSGNKGNIWLCNRHVKSTS